MLNKFYLIALIFALSPLRSAYAETKSNTPQIGLNGIFLYQRSTRGNDPLAERPNGLGLQEAELSFLSDVDPYSKFFATFSMHPELSHSADSSNVTIPQSVEYKYEPEEVYAESTQLPMVTLKVGKFKAAFGKSNTTHTHALAFVDQPLLISSIFGEEGLNDVGASACLLLPTNWFSEATLQALSGKAEGQNNYFHDASPNSAVYLMKLRNLWDLNDDSTLEWGVSAVSGENSFSTQTFHNNTTEVFGSDLTIKWRPSVGGKFHALIWSNEMAQRKIKREGGDNTTKGIVSSLQWQLSERWWVQGRAEYVSRNETDTVNPLTEEPFSRRYSALVAFLATEFSGFRVQYDHLTDSQEKSDHRLLFQLNFSIGAHPAHSY